MFQAVVCIECRAECNFSKDNHRLPEDGPDGPKHVRANA
jgi:hypothetical protein